MFQILLVGQQADRLRQAQSLLRDMGYHPQYAKSSEEGLSVLAEQHADLVLLELSPGSDGWSFLSALRDSGDETPILAVSASREQEDLYEALRTGADDYMRLPVDETELLLRIRALLRRARIARTQELRIGSTCLYYAQLTVLFGGQTIVLPKKEFQVLFKLLSFPEKTFTRVQLMDEFWPHTSESETRTVDVHINRLRAKFRDNPDFTIQTVRGIGYRAELRKGADHV